MALVIAKFSGGAAIGPVVCDAIISFDRVTSIAWSEERLADGALASDHSQVLPRRYTISGGVSDIPSPLLDSLLTGGIEGLASTVQQTGLQAVDSLSPVSTNLNTRRRDAEADLEALVTSRVPFEFISEDGKFRLVADSLAASSSNEVGDAYLFTLTGHEVLRGSVGLLDAPTELSEGLVGSGVQTAKGQTRKGAAASLELP